MHDLVLDAWAIMAWLKGQQPASDRVRALLEEAGERRRKLAMNIVNLGEVFYLCVKAKNQAYGHRVLETLRPRVMKISASDELVMLAATLKSRNAISYADAFAAATAISQEVPLVTGDPELKAMAVVEKALRVEWIGR
jgi:predicted nucleic acid-binding protein